MSQRQKWIEAFCDYLGGRVATCPSCGCHDFKEGLIELSSENGFGAFWCENCRRALPLCRADLTNVESRKKIISSLPADLKFI